MLSHYDVLSEIQPKGKNIYNDCSLGRQSYNNIQNILQNNYKNEVLPPWKNLRTEQTEITPNVMDLPEPHAGKFFSMVTAVKLTLRRLLTTFSDTQLSSLAIGCNTLALKWGADGSGNHQIYNQVNSAQTNNLILAMFCLLGIATQDGTVVWKEKHPNSPLTQRAMCVQLGKESVTSLRSLELFDRDVTHKKTFCH